MGERALESGATVAGPTCRILLYPRVRCKHPVGRIRPLHFAGSPKRRALDSLWRLEGGMGNSIDLTGRIAVVTGGAQGIGRAIVERFLKSGAAVAIWDRDLSLARRTADELKAAGRMHRRTDISRAMRILRDAGVPNISLDLIAGLPKQTHDSWRDSLEQAVDLAPEHLSIYVMEIDDGSRLGLEVLSGGSRYSARELPSEEAMVEFYEVAQAELRSAGFEQYEISNWAKPGFASRHNLKYWRREPYLGFGAGAHSFSGTHRWANIHDPARYVDALASGKSAIESVEPLTWQSAFEEEIFLGLRQLAGIDLSRIEHQYGVNLGARLERLASRGVLEREGSILRLAPEKLNISTEVLVELLRD